MPSASLQSSSTDSGGAWLKERASVEAAADVWYSALTQPSPSIYTGKPCCLETAAESAMGRLRAADARPSGERGDILAALSDIALGAADVSVVHPGAASHMRAAAQTDGTAAASQDADKGLSMGLSRRLRPVLFRPCSQKLMGGWACQHKRFFQSFATAAISSALVGSGVTMSAFQASALRELCVALG
jgi:hypothetical protein